ncbi:MAG: hypothetical protein ACRDJN_11980, partial [Chloroflexota bacterium]
WVGNTDNSPMLKVAGSLGAGYIWKDFMDDALAGRPDEPFQMPDGVVRAPICRGRQTTDVFIEGTVPSSCPPTLRPSGEWKQPLPTPTAVRRASRGGRR